MFRQKKTTDWIWIAVDIARKRYLIGNRATASGMRLWDDKRDTNELLLYRLPEVIMKLFHRKSAYKPKKKHLP